MLYSHPLVLQTDHFCTKSGSLGLPRLHRRHVYVSNLEVLRKLSNQCPKRITAPANEVHSATGAYESTTFGFVRIVAVVNLNVVMRPPRNGLKPWHIATEFFRIAELHVVSPRRDTTFFGTLASRVLDP